MKISEAKRKVRLQEWSTLLQEQQSSGMNIRNWCQNRGITEGRFYYWQKQVREALLSQIEPSHEANVPELVRVDINNAPKALPSNSMLDNDSSPQIPAPQADRFANCVHLQYKDSTLDIPVGTRAEDLSEILRALSLL